MGAGEDGDHAGPVDLGDRQEEQLVSGEGVRERERRRAVQQRE